MPCEPFQIGTKEHGLITGIGCTRGQRPIRCSVCGNRGEFLCDEPDSTRKSRTCDKGLCGNCRVQVSRDVDRCPSHESAQGALF